MFQNDYNTRELSKLKNTICYDIKLVFFFYPSLLLTLLSLLLSLSLSLLFL